MWKRTVSQKCAPSPPFCPKENEKGPFSRRESEENLSTVLSIRETLFPAQGDARSSATFFSLRLHFLLRLLASNNGGRGGRDGKGERGGISGSDPFPAPVRQAHPLSGDAIAPTCLFSSPNLDLERIGVPKTLTVVWRFGLFYYLLLFLLSVCSLKLV